MGDIMGVTTGDTINSRHQHVVHNVRQMSVAADMSLIILAILKLLMELFIFHRDAISIHFN